jgi:transmembrane sensor
MSRDKSNLPSELRSALEQEQVDEDRSDWTAVWRLLGRAAPSEEALPDADDTWAGVRHHLDEAAASDSPDHTDRRPRRPSARRSSRRRLWRWGSAVTAVLVLVVAVWWWTQPVAVTTAPGTTVAHTLPDGSTVELNGDTRLTYPRTFAGISLLEAEERVVHLQGEAYFDVASGERPFVVQTASVRVEVLGTAFSVQSRSGEAGDAHVALAEGRLRVTGRETTRRERTLRPGQAVTMTPTDTLSAVRDTSLDRVLAWRRGGFAATDRPLPALARALERRFGLSVRLDASIAEDTRSDPLTLYYSQGAELETILHDICMARGLTYRATANGYVLANEDEPQSSR